MIYILTGPIRSGKTSTLLAWSNAGNGSDGVLCPDDENGKRYFLNIKPKEKYQLEVEKNTKLKEDIISVGSFHFLKKAFDIANEYLVNLKDKTNFSYIIIDELGKLELQNQGLHCAANMLIPIFILNKQQHLILVVRESLLDEVIKHYGILKFKILKKEDLTKESFA